MFKSDGDIHYPKNPMFMGCPHCAAARQTIAGLEGRLLINQGIIKSQEKKITELEGLCRDHAMERDQARVQLATTERMVRQLEGQLREGEGILKRISSDVETLDYCPFCSGELDEDYNLQHDNDCPIQAFLAPTTPATEPDMLMEGAKLMVKGITEPDMVLVRREDLELIKHLEWAVLAGGDQMDRTVFDREVKQFRNLEAALEKP